MRKDRGIKSQLYAEHGVPEYWIVDVAEGVIEVRTEPAGDGYRRVTPYRKGDAITLQRFADVTIDMDAILR